MAKYESVGNDYEAVCNEMMVELQVNPDLGNKFYKLPNWLRSNELIVRNYRSYTPGTAGMSWTEQEDLRGLVVDFRVLGVIGNDRCGWFYRDSSNIRSLRGAKGDLLVSFTLLTGGKLQYYFVSAKSWKKITNITMKHPEITNPGVFFNVIKLNWTMDKSPHLVGSGLEASFQSSSFHNLSYVGDEGGWWVNPNNINMK